MLRMASVAAVMALALSVGCESTTTAPTGSTTVTSGSDGSGGSGFGGEESWIVETGTGGCNAVLYDPPDVSGSHKDDCSKLEWHSNPPTSGDHYGVWAAFKTYEQALPWGFALHALEHGAVALLYNCPGGCDDEVAAMQTLVDSLPEDRACSDDVARRIIITPDPNLDVQFAVSSWGHMLKAECFDAELVQAFIDEHYADGPEDLCSGGTDPFGSGGSGAGLPEDCGE